jgi:hypothetical protein
MIPKLSGLLAIFFENVYELSGLAFRLRHP